MDHIKLEDVMNCSQLNSFFRHRFSKTRVSLPLSLPSLLSPSHLFLDRWSQRLPNYCLFLSSLSLSHCSLFLSCQVPTRVTRLCGSEQESSSHSNKGFVSVLKCGGYITDLVKKNIQKLRSTRVVFIASLVLHWIMKYINLAKGGNLQ